DAVLHACAFARRTIHGMSTLKTSDLAKVSVVEGGNAILRSSTLAVPSQTEISAGACSNRCSRLPSSFFSTKSAWKALCSAGDWAEAALMRACSVIASFADQ